MLSSNLNETQPLNHQKDMSLLDCFPLIPVEEIEFSSDETWYAFFFYFTFIYQAQVFLHRLYVIGSRHERVITPTKVNTTQLSNLNATINLKETSFYLENRNAADILLQDVQVVETISECKCAECVVIE